MRAAGTLAVVLLAAWVARFAAGDRVAEGVRLQLTSGQALPEAARGPLMREVERIWNREQLPLVWQPPEAALDGRVPHLRVLVLSTPSLDGVEAWPVGELVRDRVSGVTVAVVSVAAARRVLQASGFTGEPEVLATRRLGVVLGRAVAHEIGHFVLERKGHAEYGLMRARIDARDFADLRDGAFRLDRDSRTWLRAAPVLRPRVATATH